MLPTIMDKCQFTVQVVEERWTLLNTLVEECAVDINVEDKDGSTPHLIAATYGHSPLVKYLDKQGCDPLPYKKTLSNPSALNFLDIFLKVKLNNELQMLVHDACRKGEIQTVEYCVGQCAVDINTRNKEGATPLHTAAMYGHLPVIKYLVKQGCDPQIRDVDGNLPVHYVALSGYMTVVKYFNEQLHFDISSTNNQGQTPIHLACLRGNRDIVKYLIEKCAVDINNQRQRRKYTTSCSGSLWPPNCC